MTRWIWEELGRDCNEIGAVDWEWQSAEGWPGKARFEGEKVGRNPEDHGKTGTEKSLLVDGAGEPTGAVIVGANRPNAQVLRATIEERPEPTESKRQHLCLDKGYDNPSDRKAREGTGSTPHIRRIGEEKKPCDSSKGHKSRRWVVGWTLDWLSKRRESLVRYDKKDENCLGLIHLACALF
jgi:putative transposase